jgi:hypothetical protein
MKKVKAPKAKPAKKAVKKEPIKIEKISARHDFTEAEKTDLGRKLAGLTSQKVAMGDWSQKIKTIQAEIGSVSDKITAEWELRDTECEVHFDYKAGIKTYIRVSDKKEIEKRTITEPERQQHLRFEADAKAPKIVPMAPVAPGQPLTSVDEALRKAEAAPEPQELPEQ